MDTIVVLQDKKRLRMVGMLREEWFETIQLDAHSDRMEVRGRMR